MSNTQVLVLVLIGLTILFIHGQSLNIGEKSSQISANVLKLVVRVIHPFKVKQLKQESTQQSSYETVIRENYDRLHNVLRKVAHATEFAVLGSLLFFFLRLDDSTALTIDLVLSMGIVFLVGSVDETIQRFVPGRCCRFTDVLIDFSGGIVGIFLTLIIGALL